MDLRRSIWVPDIETQEVHIFGQRWPLLFVTLWERNDIGERRYVGSTTFEIDEAEIQE